MKLHEWLSPRTVTIVGILMVILVICFHFYMKHDVRQFEADLPEVPTRGHASGLSTVSSQSDTEIEPDHEVVLPPEKNITTVVKNEKPNEADTQELASEAACSMCDMSQMDGTDTPKPKLYAGLTEKQVQQLVEELSLSNVTNANEKYDLYGEVLIAAMGPDPRIPKLVDNLKAANVLHQMAKKQADSNYSDIDVDNYLSLQPAIVAMDLAEITIDLFDYSPEKAAVEREVTSQIVEGVETFKLLQETRPIIQASINAGELSVEEGEELIRVATGLDVAMYRKDQTSAVVNQARPEEDFTIEGSKQPLSPVPTMDSNGSELITD